MSAAEQTVPVNTVLLNCLEDQLCDVNFGIAAAAQVLGSQTDPDHMQFVSDALMAALAEKMQLCFDALSEGRLMRSERRSTPAAG